MDPVRLPEQLPQQRHRVDVDALDAVNPRAVRIANAARVVDLHLLIADAVLALESDKPELALRILRGARSDMPKRGQPRSWT